MKYRDRPELYASYENDPVFKQLADKVKELQDTLKGFQEFGDQMTMLFDEAIVQPAQAVGTFAKDFYNNPGAGIRKIGSAIASKFDACVSLEDDRYCVSGDGNGNDFENPFNDFIDNFTVNKDRKSFQQVMVSISQQNTARSEDLSAAEMMSRYEVLYGQSGAGTKNVIEHLDKLIQIVDTDSLSALNEAQVCAANVRGRQCK
ncbi:hypothetical protein KBD59_02040 [Candidatus Gracilibacteria bacterium]|nr:hypothetical protein [Candidatus Gracilibacteria bacterium]